MPQNTVVAPPEGESRRPWAGRGRLITVGTESRQARGRQGTAYLPLAHDGSQLSLPRARDDWNAAAKRACAVS